MRDGTLKLGVVASSIPLIDCVREIAEETGEPIEISVQGLEGAISAGKQMERAGVEGIVGRGGTSHLLRENLQIPVLSIPLTYLDLLSSAKEAASKGKKVLLTTFRSRISDLTIIEEIFPIELKQGIFDNSESLERVILSAKKQGCEVVIGGGMSMKLASQYGLHGVELKTARETVLSVIDDAKAIIRSRRKEQEKTERYRCIVDSVSEGIIAVDRKGEIISINKSARDILQLREEDVSGRPVRTLIPQSPVLKVITTGRSVLNKVETIKGSLFVTNHVPVIIGSDLVGGVSTFKDMSTVVKAEREFRRSCAKGLVAKYSLDDVVHKSQVMEDVIKRAKRFAGSDSTLLIAGETGTGKEILAHGIHAIGARRRKPFVSINCAALPEQLLESELFGYEDGAFTGSRRGGKPGLFEIAHEGTIFLDEIGATPQSVQTRLLRVLQEKEVMRIGADRLISVNVRVIAATNKELHREVQLGNIREDLFFRLNILHIHLPPLRNRTGDLPLLMNTLIKRTAKKYNVKAPSVPDSCIKRLMAYAWPGNVRQLENFVERFLLLSEDRFRMEIFDELFDELTAYTATNRSSGNPQVSMVEQHYAGSNAGNHGSREIWKALEEEQFCKSRAARRLGMSRTTLWRKLKEHPYSS